MHFTEQGLTLIYCAMIFFGLLIPYGMLKWRKNRGSATAWQVANQYRMTHSNRMYAYKESGAFVSAWESAYHWRTMQKNRWLIRAWAQRLDERRHMKALRANL